MTTNSTMVSCQRISEFLLFKALLKFLYFHFCSTVLGSRILLVYAVMESADTRGVSTVLESKLRILEMGRERREFFFLHSLVQNPGCWKHEPKPCRNPTNLELGSERSANSIGKKI